MNEQRGPARKPDVRVVAKMKDASLAQRFVDIGAWWRQDDGALRGGWDKRIVAVKLADGRVLQVADAFLNLQETAQQPQRTPRPGSSTGGTSGFGANAKHTAPPDDGGPDFGEDDGSEIPF